MSDKTEKLLGDLKNLIVLQLYKSGVKPEEIGKTLGVGASRVKNIIYGVGKNDKERRE